MLALLRRWRYVLVALVLAAFMLAFVLVVRPTWETIALCFLAWFGGVACSLAAQSIGEMTRQKATR